MCLKFIYTFWFSFKMTNKKIKSSQLSQNSQNYTCPIIWVKCGFKKKQLIFSNQNIFLESGYDQKIDTNSKLFVDDLRNSDIELTNVLIKNLRSDLILAIVYMPRL